MKSKEISNSIVNNEYYGTLISLVEQVQQQAQQLQQAEIHTAQTKIETATKTETLSQSQLETHLFEQFDQLKKQYKQVESSIHETHLEIAQLDQEIGKVSEEKYTLQDIVNHSNEYRKTLFPEYLKRVYNAEPESILENWRNLVEKEGTDKAVNTVIAKPEVLNPKLFGSLKGFGVGKILGLSSNSRVDAIVNIEVLGKRFKEYEDSSGRALLAESKLLTGRHDERQQELLAMKADLERNLPNDDEKVFLNILNSVDADTNSYDKQFSLNHLVATLENETVKESVFSYYNSKNVELQASELQATNEGEHINVQEKVQSRVENQKQVKEIQQHQQPEQNKKAQYISYKEVNNALNSTHFEEIFKTYANYINSDGKIAKRGNSISCGSLSMNLRTGQWYRFSNKQGGDIFKLVVEAGYSKADALEIVASHVGISVSQLDGLNGKDLTLSNNNTQSVGVAKEAKASKTVKEIKDQWVAYKEVFNDAPDLNLRRDLGYVCKGNDVEAIYSYRNSAGNLIGYTARLISSEDGTKQVLPIAYCYNEAVSNQKNQNQWKLKGFTDNGYKPIYGAEKLNEDRKVILIVEGEKAADKAQELFPEYSVMSWLGGSNGADKVNWSQLKERDVIIWPDNDQPGFKAASVIANAIDIANGHRGMVSIIDPRALEFNSKVHEIENRSQGQGQNHDQNQSYSQNLSLLEQGWDLADKLPEGVTYDDVRKVMKEAKTIESIQELWQGAWQDQKHSDIAFELQSRLGSEEAQNSIKYAEAKGRISSEHEFLNLEHGLYRDTLVAIATNETVKAQTQIRGVAEINETVEMNKVAQTTSEKNTKNANLINDLSEIQSKYQLKVIGLYTSGKHFERYQNKLDTMTTAYKAEDCRELFDVLVRDVILLHKEQLGYNLTRAHEEAIAKIVYGCINSEAVKSTDSNTLRNEDFERLRIIVAENVYQQINSQEWWKELSSTELEMAQQVRQKANVELKEFFAVNRIIVDDMVKLNPDYNFKSLEQDLISLNDKDRDNLLETKWVETFRGFIIPRLKEINQDKLEADSPQKMIDALTKEKEFCYKMQEDHWSASIRLKNSKAGDQIQQVNKLYMKEPGVLEQMQQHVDVLVKHSSLKTNLSESKILEHLKSHSDLKEINCKLHSTCQEQILREVRLDLKHIVEHRELNKDGMKFNTQKAYLEHRLHDKMLGHYLKDSVAEKHLDKLYEHEKQLELQKEKTLNMEMHKVL